MLIKKNLLLFIRNHKSINLNFLINQLVNLIGRIGTGMIGLILPPLIVNNSLEVRFLNFFMISLLSYLYFLKSSSATESPSIREGRKEF